MYLYIENEVAMSSHLKLPIEDDICIAKKKNMKIAGKYLQVLWHSSPYQFPERHCTKMLATHFTSGVSKLKEQKVKTATLVV